MKCILPVLQLCFKRNETHFDFSYAQLLSVEKLLLSISWKLGFSAHFLDLVMFYDRFDLVKKTSF